MSAFVVSRSTMQRCVSALHDRKQSCQDADQLGRDLFRLNERAVAHRYRDTTPVPPPGQGIYDNWTWRVTCPLLWGDYPDDIALACDWVKALQCLLYQCSEGDEVPATPLYARIEKRIRQLESHIVGRLPQYQAARWDSEVPA